MIEDLKNILKLPSWRQTEAIQFLIEKLEAEDQGEKRKTDKQRGALHVGCGELADHLNAIGKDMRTVLKPEVSIPWTMLTVKEYLFKPILKSYANKDSTEDMDKHEPGQVWDIMMKFLGEHHHVKYMPWPSVTKIDREQDYKNDAREMREELEYPESQEDNNIRF